MKHKYVLFLSILFLGSCSYDSQESLFGISDCDTNYVSFEMHILPIVTSHCTACHSGPNSSDGLVLETYAQIKSSALEQGSNGMINRIIRPEGSVGSMPQNYRLEDCQIEKIKVWVEEGAQNN